MKRCPTCDKTFADGMKFCQTDGTVLVDDAPLVDPYKTVVANQNDIASAIPPLDPFKTMVASSPPKIEDDLLDLPPEDADSMKTMLVSQDEINAGFKSDKTEDAPKLDVPPPAPRGGAVPIIEPKPKSNEPLSNPPIFGDSGQEAKIPKPPAMSPGGSSAGNDLSGSLKDAPSKFDSKASSNDFTSKSPYGDLDNAPIPSPFQDSMPPGYQTPFSSPFNEPQPEEKKSEPTFDSQPNSPVQSPFDTPSSPQTPFGQPEPFNQSLGQAEWTPPPVPGWQDQGASIDQPFQPSAAGTGQNQTLAIVSLLCGILSFVCLGILAAIPAVITGYMQRNNVKNNPSEYGGGTMALIGMILGGVNIALTVVVVVIYIILIIAAASR